MFFFDGFGRLRDGIRSRFLLLVQFFVGRVLLGAFFRISGRALGLEVYHPLTLLRLARI